MGAIFKFAGYLLAFVAGLYGFLICLSIVSHELGFLGAVIGFMLFLVMLTVAPFYALVAYRAWWPLIVCYGGMIGAYVLSAIAVAIDG